MKKFLLILLFIIIAITSIFIFLNMSVTTRQGINFQWHTIRIPLYLKILDFFDRHYNYKQLTKKIIENTKTDKERVMKIFEWTYQNIKKAPSGFPVIDDHVWHIIIRGYGISDQSSDVFTTLCNYAGMDASFSWVSTQDRSQRIPLSFVRINGKWFVFDPYRGVYFKNSQGNDKLADIETLKSTNKWLIESIGIGPLIDYSIYFKNLSSIKKIGLTRANTQSPLKRFIFEVKKWIEVK